MILKVCLIFLLFVIHYFVTIIIFIIVIITHREITISGVVSNLESDNTTPSLTRSFERRSSFGAQSGCNRERRVRGSRCARFEVHTVVGREDMSNLLLLMCYKGGALYAGSIIYITIYLLLLRSIMVHWIGENIIFNNQPGYGSNAR